MTIQALALVANLFLSVILLVVGGRLLNLSSKTRQLPELILGVSCCAASGVLLTMLGLSLTGRDVESAGPLAMTARSLLATSVISIGFLAWRVFRPTSLWACSLFAWFTLCLVILVIANPRLTSDVSPTTEASWWAARLSMVFTYVWAGSEAYIYQRALRRRQRFGLAPKSRAPTRILLWSAALGLTAVMYFGHMSTRVADYYFHVSMPALFLTSVSGFLVSICLWLAFFPPKALFPQIEGDSRE